MIGLKVGWAAVALDDAELRARYDAIGDFDSPPTQADQGDTVDPGIRCVKSIIGTVDPVSLNNHEAELL
jgi:hypothetical protein